MGVGQNGKGKRVAGTDTFRAILFDNIPQDRRKEITYTSVVCEVHPQEEEPNCIRTKIGGNHICYPGDTGTNTESLELFKLLLNIVLSQNGAKFRSCDVNFFTLAPRLTAQSTSKSNLPTSPKNLLMNMTSPSTPATGGYTLKLVRVCMTYPNKAGLPMTNSESVLKIRLL